MATKKPQHTAQHTPGPWRVIKKASRVGYADHEIAWSDDGELVADVVYTEADARLIAAAPDLLKACQLIVNAFDALKPASAARSEPLQINFARAAIAKAEGRTA